MSKKRSHYSDDYRATAILMLEAQGYPENVPALKAVANHLHIPISTLRGWYKRENNPVPAHVRILKKLDLQTVIRDELYNALSAMDNTRVEASYRELTIAAGIMFDKLQLLEGKPTARVHVGDWRSEAIALIQSGDLTFQAIAYEFTPDLATQLFRAANCPIEPDQNAASAGIIPVSDTTT